MKRIIVSGALANKLHNGGEAWVRLSWILGLRQLGHQVHFIEQLEPENALGPDGRRCDFAGSESLAYFRRVISEYGLSGAASLVANRGEHTFGESMTDLIAMARQADLLVNISGHLTLDVLKDAVACRAYIDIDPGFTQFWEASGNKGAHLDGHDRYFTIWQYIGSEDCPIPTNGLPWKPVRQPVVLDHWPVVETGPPVHFTTVASWRGSFGPVEFGGKRYGIKAHEFRKVIALPGQTGAPFDVALDIHPGDAADIAALKENRWNLIDPKKASASPASFRKFVQDSGAEFSVAQGIYVDTNSGWFSDRTVRYLASGKPALVQDTGFSRFLPAGNGLMAFRNLDDAGGGVREILKDYDRHCQAARHLAESHFDSNRVLTNLLNEIFGE